MLKVDGIMKKILDDIGSLYDEDICDLRGTVINERHVRNYFSEHYHRTEEIVKYVSRIGSGKEILDIGMGYGFYDIVLKEVFGFDVTGLEMEGNIPVYCRLLESYNIDVIPGELSRKECSVPDDSFDIVIFSEVLEHLRIPPMRALLEIKRILKPEGLLLLTTPNVGRLTNILKLVSGRNITSVFPDDDAGLGHITDKIAHLREYTMGEVTTLMRRVGYKIIKAVYSLSTDKPRPNSSLKQKFARAILLPSVVIAPSLRSSMVFLGKKEA